MVVPHFAVDFGLRHKGCHRVHNNDVDSARTYERFGNVESLLAGIRLGHEERFDIDTELTSINRIKSVFCVDEGCNAAKLLSFCNSMQSKRCLTGRFRSINFNDTSARETAYAKCHVELNATRRNDRDIFDRLLTEGHDGTFTVILFDLGDSRLDCFCFFAGKVASRGCSFLSHIGLRFLSFFVNILISELLCKCFFGYSAKKEACP